MFKHLRTKLTVLYASLFIVALAAIALAVYITATSNEEHLGRDQLAASGTVFDNLLATRNEALQDEAEILAQDYGFRAALASKDAATVRSALGNLASRLGLNMAYVVDLQGQVTAQDAGLDTSLAPDVIAAVQQADDAAAGIFRVHGAPYEGVAAPIRMPATAGWVVFAKALTGADMAQLERLSAIPLQATVIGRGHSEWTSLDQAHPLKTNPNLTALLDHASSASKAERIAFGDRGGDSLVFARRLASLGDGQEMLLLRYPMSDALRPFNALFRGIVLVGVGSVLLLIFGSWLIARTVTRPISALGAVARRLQAGDNDARVALSGGDEIAALGGAFNAMADAITEREVSLLHAKEQAETADRAKGEFLANMNHELRTPLNGVLGAASVLVTTSLDPQQKRMVDLIQGSGEGLQRIVNGVLDLVELGSGEMQLLDQPFDLAALLHTLGAANQGAAKAKGLSFHLALDPKTGWVTGDQRRLGQILSSLLENAVKFTDEGEIALCASTEGRVWRFEVRDSGVGFDPKHVEDLFRAFRQADGSMTRRFGGVGLGLSLARDLARAMGGDITATSTPGAGACFTLALPLAAAEAPAPRPLADEPASAEDGVEPAPLRILLAEDNPANRTVVELILGALGVELVSTENGDEALAAYRQQSFDVVLMDLQMPVMDGLTAIRLIREHETASMTPRTPIIVLSANAQAGHLKASASAGADMHLAKPIVAGLLIGALEQVLSEQPGRQAA